MIPKMNENGDEMLKKSIERYDGEFIETYLDLNFEDFLSLIKSELQRPPVGEFNGSHGLDLFIYNLWLEFVWQPFIGRRTLDTNMVFIRDLPRLQQIYLLTILNDLTRKQPFRELMQQFDCQEQKSFARRLAPIIRATHLWSRPYRLSLSALTVLICRIIADERGCPPMDAPIA